MGVYEAYGRLAAQLQGGVLADERMHRHTSYRIGGPAALFITCDSYADLRVANAVLREEGVPWVVMGRGSNVLVSDEGYGGAVITLGKEFRRFALDEDDRLHVGAGAVLQRIVTEAFDRGLSGLEFAVGIPGTVGGAVSMNAGTAERWIDSVVNEVVTFRPGEGLVRYAGADIAWFYRGSEYPPARDHLGSDLCPHARRRARGQAGHGEHACPPQGRPAPRAAVVRQRFSQPAGAEGLPPR